MIFAAEAEALLNPRMQKCEFIAKRLFVDGSHVPFSGLRRHCAAVGRSRNAMIAISAKPASERFKVTGLKAALRYSGALTPTMGIPTSIKTRVTQSGQLRRHKSSSNTAKQISATPARVAAVCRF